MRSPSSRCLHHRLLGEVVAAPGAAAAGEMVSRALSHRPCDPAPHEFVVVDCESTSGDVHLAGLLEVAAVVLAADGSVVSTFSSLVCDTEPFNTDVHSIDEVLVAHGRPAADVARLLAPLVSGRVLVAFRPELDVALLDRLFSASGLRVEVPYVLCLADHAPLLHSESRSLAGLAADCDVVNVWPHRAPGDALCEALIFQRLLSFGLVGSVSVTVPWRGCGGWLLGCD